MTPDPGRECPFCAETISARAKVCPRCRQWLSLRSLRHPAVNGVVTILPLLVLFGGLLMWGAAWFERVFNPRPFYSEMPQALQVLEARMNWVETTNQSQLYVTGLLTNRSGIGWKDVEFECRFFDSAGVMVDAGHGRSFFTIQPHDDSAFRVIVRPGRPAADYHALKVTVATARNAGAAF